MREAYNAESYEIVLKLLKNLARVLSKITPARLRAFAKGWKRR